MTDARTRCACPNSPAADKAGDTASLIKNGLYCTVQGKMVYDSFAKEMVLGADRYRQGEKARTAGQGRGQKRVELHLHTNMSAMDGMSSTAALLCRRAAQGDTAPGDHRPRCSAGLSRSPACAGGQAEGTLVI